MTAAACAAPICTSPRATSRRIARRRARPRDRRRRRRARPGPRRFAVGRAHRRRLAGAAPTAVPLLPPRRGEPVRAPRFTGWDVDGGYADPCVVDEAFAYRAPGGIDDEQAAPLLCAGIIGYRALRAPTCRRAGGSASTASAAARTSPRRWRSTGACGCTCSPAARGNRQLARELGVDSVGRRPTARRPSPWTARSCSPRPASWSRRRCGRSTAAATWPWPGSGSPTSRRSNYADELFQERQLRSVTANTRADGEGSCAWRTASVSARPPRYPMAAPRPCSLFRVLQPVARTAQPAKQR